MIIPITVASRCSTGSSKLPVVPVAINSGLFWARRAATPRGPGEITVSYSAAQSRRGLAADEFMDQAEKLPLTQEKQKLAEQT